MCCSLPLMTSKVLEVAEPFRRRLEELRENLLPILVGKDGRLMECADLKWKDGRLQGAVIKSLNGNSCKLKCGDRTVEFETEAGQQYRFDGSLEMLK